MRVCFSELVRASLWVCACLYTNICNYESLRVLSICVVSLSVSVSGLVSVSVKMYVSSECGFICVVRVCALELCVSVSEILCISVSNSLKVPVSESLCMFVLESLCMYVSESLCMSVSERVCVFVSESLCVSVSEHVCLRI